MITSLKFVADTYDLLQYEVDGRIERIPFSSIREYWEYATVEDFEGGSAYVSDSRIIGFITVASGQAGVVFVWNVENHLIEHLSEGAYTISVLLHGDTIYNLCCVMNYATPAHFMLCKAKLGTKDASTVTDVMEFNCSCSVDEYNGSFGSVKLMANKEKLYLSANGKEYPLHINNTALE